MPSKQTARRATAKARSSARSQATVPNDSAKGAGKGQNATPQLRCGCCDASGCACAQQRLDDLRASFDHAIQVVFDHGEDEVFMYTVGADPEFLMEDVPKNMCNKSDKR